MKSVLPAIAAGALGHGATATAEQPWSEAAGSCGVVPPAEHLICEKWCRVMLDLHEARPIARMLAGLGEPTRLQIALCLLQRPHFVSELAEILQMPMVNVSHHLGVLRQAGLVEDVKKGRRVEYRLREEVRDAAEGSNPQAVLKLGPYRLWIVHAPPIQPPEEPPPRRRGRPRRRTR